MKHIVQKQILQLTLAPGVEAFGAQHAASRFYREVLMPLLERAFNELAGEGFVIRVDRLVLDLGTMSVHQLTLCFPEGELYQQLKEQLRKMMMTGGADGFAQQLPWRVSVLGQWWYYMEKGRLPWNADTVNSGWHRMVLEGLSVDAEAVGRLRQALAGTAFRQRVSRQHDDVFLEELVSLLVGSTMAGLSAVSAGSVQDSGGSGAGAASGGSAAAAGFGGTTGSGAASGFGAAGFAGSRPLSLSQRIEEVCAVCGWLEKKYLEGLEATASDSGKRGSILPVERLRRWRNEHVRFLALSRAGRKAAVWELVLQEAARQRETAGIGSIAFRLMRWVSEDAEIHGLLRGRGSLRGGRSLDGSTSSVAADRQTEAPAEPSVGVGGQHEPEGLSTAGVGERSGEEPTVGKKKERPTDEGPAAVGDGKELRSGDLSVGQPAVHKEDHVPAVGRDGGDGGVEEEERLFDRRMVDEDGFYGRLAGLILLHPYLSTLFGRCGLYDAGGFIDKQARHQAVFLLYYLGMGEKEGPEYDMLFPKLLCGCDPEDTLPVTVELPDSVYAEAEELLQLVLQRWEKLQHSSVGALREGFLQRVGKLVKRNDRLVLVMEISAIDVLLDYLPWNLSIVKLPWWKELLHVEWR